MPPDKHEKTPASKTSAIALPPVTPAAASAAVDSSTPVAPPLTAIDVADQLHSAAIHLLRRLRIRDRE
ncbi:MAG: hypothetical protein WA817_18760, partial [Candidatus Acidiferrum sp.]